MFYLRKHFPLPNFQYICIYFIPFIFKLIEFLFNSFKIQFSHGMWKELSSFLKFIANFPGHLLKHLSFPH